MTAAMVALVFMQAALNLTPPPAPDFKSAVDYVAWYEKTATTGMTPEQNAAALYNAIFGDPPDGAVLEFDGPLTQESPLRHLEPWDPKTQPAWEAAYQKMKPKLEQFRRAAAKSYAWWGVRFDSTDNPRLLLSTSLSEIPLMRLLAKGALENAWRASGGKVDANEFVAAMRDALGVARQVQRNPIMISQLVALAIRSVVYEQLLRAADLNVLAAKPRAEVIRLLTDGDNSVPPFRYSMNAELACAFDYAQFIQLTNGGMYGGARTPLEKGPLRYDAPRCRDAINACFASLAAESDKPFDSSTVFRMDAAVKTLDGVDPMAAVMMSGLSRAYELHLRVVATRRGTRLVYELLAYRDANDRWPASLADLPPNLEPDGRLDPFSNKPFVYRVENGQPLLYSVAKNAKDDGGTTHDSKWGDKTAESDYIIWPYQR